jgi:histidinol-phosphate aminotransferase
MTISTPIRPVPATMRSASAIEPDRDAAGRPIDLRLDANECSSTDDRSGPDVVGASRIDLARYPDRRSLESVIASRSGIDPDRVLVTAGADDAIDRICRDALASGDRITLLDPTFPMFERFAAQCGGSVDRVAWMKGRFPIEAVIESGRGAAVVALVTPNNPTGLTISAEAIRRIRRELPDTLLVIDLAYAEFATSDPGEVIRDLPNTVLIRTLSKAWALAGLRVGWVESSPAIASRLRESGGPYPVSSISIDTAIRFLSDPSAEAAMRKRVDRIRANRSRMVEWLDQRGIERIDSEGNFVLVRMPDARWMADALASAGIAVRTFRESIIEDWIRITVPIARADLDRVLAAMDAASRPEAMLFDLDGVIADVSRSYRVAIRTTAEAFGAVVEDGAIEAIKADGDANDDWALTRRLIQRSGIGADSDAVTREFQRRYLGEGDRPGLRELESVLVDPTFLRRLRDRMPIGLVTGRPRAEAIWFLDRHGLTGLFDVVVAREDAPLKPSPRGIRSAMDTLGIERAWFVGDTVDDVVAAKDAGLVPIGVSVDSDGDEILDRAGAARVVRPGPAMQRFIEGGMA